MSYRPIINTTYNECQFIMNFMQDMAMSLFNRNRANRSTRLTIISAGLLASLVSLSACQSTPTSPVMQRENSVFETTGLGKTKIIAQQNALASAKKTCGMRQPIVLTDGFQYNGVFDESTGRMVQQATTVVGAVLGRKAPNLSRDDDYEFNITFRCE